MKTKGVCTTHDARLLKSESTTVKTDEKLDRVSERVIFLPHPKQPPKEANARTHKRDRHPDHEDRG